MINLKIVLLGFYFPAFVLLLAQESLDIANLTGFQLIGACALFSFACGLVAGHRETEHIDVNIILKTGLNAAMFGFVLGSGSVYFLIDDPLKGYLVVAFSGAVSLGGMTSIDIIRKKIFKTGLDKIGEPDDN